MRDHVGRGMEARPAVMSVAASRMKAVAKRGMAAGSRPPRRRISREKCGHSQKTKRKGVKVTIERVLVIKGDQKGPGCRGTESIGRIVVCRRALGCEWGGGENTRTAELSK